MANEGVRKIIAQVPESLYRAAKVKAAKTGRPVSEVIREALREWTKDDDPPEDKRGIGNANDESGQ